jgi:hypothetical protein
MVGFGWLISGLPGARGKGSLYGFGFWLGLLCSKRFTGSARCSGEGKAPIFGVEPAPIFGVEPLLEMLYALKVSGWE